MVRAGSEPGREIPQVRLWGLQGKALRETETEVSRTFHWQGIITSDGQRWLEHRRFTIRHLKEFGFGRIGLESVIQEEAEELVKYFTVRKDQDIRSVVSSIVVDKRYD